MMTAPERETYAWRSTVKTPRGRLRQLLRVCDPWGTAPSSIKLCLHDDAGRGGSVLARCHTVAPAAWHVSMVGQNWRQAGLTTGQLLTSGNGSMCLVLIHEFCHWLDVAYPQALATGAVPDPATDFRGWLDSIHRSSFQRVNTLLTVRCLEAGLLAEVGNLLPCQRHREAVPPTDAADVWPPCPTPVGLWPNAGEALGVFAGLPAIAVFRLADQYADGFPAPPADWQPDVGAVYGWPGSVYAWRVYSLKGDTAYCDRVPGPGTWVLPSYCVKAMEAHA
jgi:hypothetical protein